MTLLISWETQSKGGRLKFYFEDGDGNLGLPAPEPGQENDSTNLFFTLYRMTDGVMDPAPDDDPLKPSDYRIPYMERTGQNKILKGYNFGYFPLSFLFRRRYYKI